MTGTDPRVALCVTLGAAAVALLVTIPLAGVEPGEATRVDLGRGPWSEVTFSASKFFLSATATLKLRVEPAETAARSMRVAPRDGSVSASGDRVAVVEVISDLPFGRGEEVTVWLDSQGGRVLQWEKRSIGGKPYQKQRRYTEDGYYQWRRAPASASEEGAPPREWSEESEQDVSLPAPPGAPVLTDSYVLLLLASAADLDEPGRSVSFHIISDERRVELTFEAAGLIMKRFSFEEVWSGGSRRRRESLVAREIVVRARVVDGGDDPEADLGFLGLKGELSIFVDAASGVPLELSGRAETIGRLLVRLERVVLTEPPRA